MNDLNAPLGKNLPPKKRAPKTPTSPPTGRGFAVILGVIFIGILALNIYIFIDTHKDTGTLVVRLPEPEPIEIAEAKSEPEADKPDVEVIYGQPDANLSQEPIIAAERETITEVSPGGPRIITIRDPQATEIGQPDGQRHRPVQSALEETDAGKLPKRTDDGRRPVDIYARPWSNAGGKRIAIVIGGLGLSQTGTQRALDQLPPEITLAFAPTGNSLDRWMGVARKKGHELLMQIPMEPFNYPQVNPGPHTLRLASSPETNLENLQWAMARMTNYSGVTNYLGARFMGDKQAITPILEELGERGLLFFNDGSSGTAGNLGADAARARVPYAAANVIIDNSNSPDDIRTKLKALEALAEARGTAIGTGSALELTVKTVAEWANQAKKNGFEIVGIAALASDPERKR
ncbi:divergent polysaccharide deacetylase family protein [Ahrensia sp. 13_GOM-1096m]|uniref:divergent polysaccharide deacetylase family protein n=1 Tax=Ahrensia sp. 13_GOM-1096m TaxID=1380380 RepID=UPI00047A71A1|nr:divergent polysaccharide deacetylase family protein [Ahrensia sp. 13_GOM-1096m]